VGISNFTLAIDYINAADLIAETTYNDIIDGGAGDDKLLGDVVSDKRFQRYFLNSENNAEDSLGSVAIRLDNRAVNDPEKERLKCA